MDLGLKGRTAIVFGASSGLGLASAEALAEESAKRRHVRAPARRARARGARIGAVPVVGDVRKPDDIARAVDTAVEKFGGIDILVPNSGGPPGAKAVEIDAQQMQEAVDLLLLPVVRLVSWRYRTC